MPSSRGSGFCAPPSPPPLRTKRIEARSASSASACLSGRWRLLRRFAGRRPHRPRHYSAPSPRIAKVNQKPYRAPSSTGKNIRLDGALIDTGAVKNVCEHNLSLRGVGCAHWSGAPPGCGWLRLVFLHFPGPGPVTPQGLPHTAAPGGRDAALPRRRDPVDVTNSDLRGGRAQSAGARG